MVQTETGGSSMGQTETGGSKMARHKQGVDQLASQVQVSSFKDYKFLTFFVWQSPV